MQFKLLTSDLVSILATVTRALSSKPVRPILDGVLVEAADNAVTLTCTDGSLAIRAAIPAMIEADGKAVLPGRLLNDLVRRLPGSDVTFTADGASVRVRSGKSRSTLTAQNAADYPEVSPVTGGHTFAVRAGRLKDMIGRARVAIAADESRLALTGIHAEVESGTLTLVTLDGFRLAAAEDSGGYGFDAFSADIPGRAMAELERILPSGDETCAVRITDSHMSAEFCGVTVSTVLLQAQFPDYKRIVPKEFATESLVSRDEMLAAIDRASLMARDSRNNLVRMTVTVDAISVTGRADVGQVEETVSAATTGSGLTVAFNAKYLTDALKAIGCDAVVMRFTGPTAPCVIVPQDSRDTLYLILPVRTA